MIPTSAADFRQFLGPIPAVGQDIEFAGKREPKVLEHPLRHSDFGLETATSFGPSGMIEPGSKGQKGVFIEQSRKHPLVAKDVGHILGMIFMPSTPGDLLPGLLHEGVIHQKKEDGVGFDSQGVEESVEGDLPNFLRRPSVLSQKAGKTGKRSLQKMPAEGANQGGGMSFFAQLDETDDKRGEELARRP
jgi:hypothetical protein